MPTARLFPWLLRLFWAVLPFTVGPALAAVLDQRSDAVQTVASTGLWLGWAVSFGATLVLHPISLTMVRLAAPFVVSVAVAAAIEGEVSAMALSSALVAALVAFAAEIGAAYVNGSAYPNERRLPLRVPGPLLFGPLALAWALAVVLPSVAVLLLAAERWVAGGILVAIAAPISFVLVRAMHGLSRRWVVFVPAGLVLHDPMTLADPVLFRRQTVGRLGPAAADTDALDLTQRAPGIALELASKEEVQLVLTKPGRAVGDTVTATKLLFTPTRPGAVVEEARERRFPVG
jgi:hypothetical protein